MSPKTGNPSNLTSCFATTNVVESRKRTQLIAFRLARGTEGLCHCHVVASESVRKCNRLRQWRSFGAVSEVHPTPAMYQPFLNHRRSPSFTSSNNPLIHDHSILQPLTPMVVLEYRRERCYYFSRSDRRFVPGFGNNGLRALELALQSESYASHAEKVGV